MDENNMGVVCSALGKETNSKRQGCTIFPIIWELSQTSRCQKGDMNQSSILRTHKFYQSHYVTDLPGGLNAQDFATTVTRK
jgi:hypothetical protein